MISNNHHGDGRIAVWIPPSARRAAGADRKRPTNLYWNAACDGLRYKMIRSFRHKGLKRLFDENDSRGLNIEHMQKLRRVLARTDSAKVIADMDLPGSRLRALKGDLQGLYSVTVRANWRVIFQFEQGEALNVDYLDYH